MVVIDRKKHWRCIIGRWSLVGFLFHSFYIEKYIYYTHRTRQDGRWCSRWCTGEGVWLRQVESNTMLMDKWSRQLHPRYIVMSSYSHTGKYTQTGIGYIWLIPLARNPMSEVRSNSHSIATNANQVTSFSEKAEGTRFGRVFGFGKYSDFSQCTLQLHSSMTL